MSVVCYVDGDQDGYGGTSSEESTFIASGGVADLSPNACGSDDADGYDDEDTDCDDANAGIFPGATEVCDGADNDCNMQIDDDDPGVVDAIAWCADADMDTFGDPAVQLTACDMPPNFVLDCTDCDDGDSMIGGGCEVPIFQDGFESPP